MSIKDVAMRVWGMTAVEADTRTGEQILSDFAEALVAELAKENEPVYYLWENKYGDPQQMLSSNSGPHPEYVITALYTLPPTAEQIEQRVAEACRKMAVSWGNARLDDNGGHALRNFATAVEIEEWRKYL